MADPDDRAVVDPGIDDVIKTLTQEQIEKTIMHVLNNESMARMKVYLETCVHCGSQILLPPS